jgi:hypothetical protein
MTVLIRPKRIWQQWHRCLRDVLARWHLEIVSWSPNPSSIQALGSHQDIQRSQAASIQNPNPSIVNKEIYIMISMAYAKGLVIV